MSLKFQLSDAGRSTGARPKEKRDCTVRALAHATGIAYDDVHDFLASRGRKYRTGFDALRTSPEILFDRVTH